MEADCEQPADLLDWDTIVPKMDIWLDVAPNEMHYVASIIPTLKWRGGKLGVRLALLPKDVAYTYDCEAVKATAMKNNWFEDDEIRLLE